MQTDADKWLYRLARNHSRFSDSRHYPILQASF